MNFNRNKVDIERLFYLNDPIRRQSGGVVQVPYYDLHSLLLYVNMLEFFEQQDKLHNHFAFYYW